MQLVTYHVFEKLQFLFLNYDLFKKCDKCLERNKYQSEGHILPLVFADSPRTLTTMMKTVAPKLLGIVIVEVDRQRNPSTFLAFLMIWLPHSSLTRL